MNLHATAEHLLRTFTGNADAAFRPGQWEAISRLAEGRGRVLVVQRTGWGKSAVYFLATRLLREQGAGPTLLVSPLLALMRNQIEMAERAGVRAATINSANREEWHDVEARVQRGEVDILLIAPERLHNLDFRRDVLPELAKTVGLLVVDEAHCISDWGHDFRPDYRRLARVLDQLPGDVPVLCTTATANDRVVADIAEQLGHDLEVVRGPLDRESLALSVVDLPNPAHRLAWLAAVLPTLPGSGIVYCLTVDETTRVAAWLVKQGIGAVAYSGQTDHDDRIVSEAALLDNSVKVVVATLALGMGFDKPDLTFVIHFQSPGSPIAYYQQVGRAGRGVDQAVGVLLRGHEDADIQDWFIRTAFPPAEHAEGIVEVLEARAGPVSVGELEREVNARRTRIQGALKVLEVEGAVERVEARWQRTGEPWSYDAERVARVTALRRAEQRAMVEYAATADCRMQFLRHALDDRDARPCGRCDRCTGSSWDVALDPATVAEALAHIRATRVVLEPRRTWPPGMGEPAGRIPVDRQAELGRVLGTYGDGGWGNVVRDAKEGGGGGGGRGGGRFPDELVEAAVGVVAEWAPEPAPAWVTSVPSTTSAGVADVARRVADALRLPFVPAVERVRPGRPQKELGNSVQQVGNVYDAFAVTNGVPLGPVLLVDDVVDSRWTVTVVASALRGAGVAAVHPLVLARAMG